VDILIRQFDHFVEEAHRLKAVYAPRIVLLVGLETEFITTTDLDQLELLLQRHQGRIEYIVGSVHHVNGVPIDFDLPTFHAAVSTCQTNTVDHSKESSKEDCDNQNKADSAGDQGDSDSERFLFAYLDAQYALLRRFRPEIIGHIDLCRLYTPALRFSDFPHALTRLERNISFAVAYGALFEVNAAAFRKGWDSAYPANDVLQASAILQVLRLNLVFMIAPTFAANRAAWRPICFV
jgi:histidinol-phosphatase (PHP family)